MQIELMNKKINYEFKGDGEAMLFIHGWGGDLHSVNGLYEHFSKEFKCYRLDLPGFGKSQNPDSDWGIAEYSNLVKTFVDEVIDEKVIYCGHSFGGGIGIYLAANFKIINKMILLAPAFRRDVQKKTFFSDIIPLYSKLKPFLYPIRKVGYSIFYPGSQVLRYPHLEENFKKLVTQTLVPILHKIDVKTLIIWGDSDLFVPVKDAYLLHKKLKNSDLRIYEGVNHNVQSAKIKKVINDITCFLNKK
jgi:pimeloyl-ACP methyl ester carboxylesterase